MTASEAVIPALSLRYDGLDASGVGWLDDVTPYVEWNSIVKPADGFNDSTLVTMGAAWTLYGALYVYSELVFSDGSFFVGSNGDFSANDNNAWEWLLNFNFSYEFQAMVQPRGTVVVNAGSIGSLGPPAAASEPARRDGQLAIDERTDCPAEAEGCR